MSLTTGPELGVEVLGPAEAEYLLEETDIAGKENETLAVSGQ
jgi:hypothetical protein